MAQFTCSIPGCDSDKPAYRGLCSKHYGRWRRHRDPLITKNPYLPAAERFWKKFAVDGNGCWVWNHPATNGYGVLSVNRRPVWAHRFAYELLMGPIPSDKELDHLCCNKACVNPVHLEPVTHGENIRRGWRTTRRKTA